MLKQEVSCMLGPVRCGYDSLHQNLASGVGDCKPRQYYPGNSTKNNYSLWISQDILMSGLSSPF